ncbi:MAG: BON domain-containing protein [Woeseiaceae bacterium]
MRNLVFLLFALMLVGCSGMMLGGGSSSSGTSGSSSTTGSQASDIEITGKVREVLVADPRVDAASINVSTRAGLVRLSGVAGSYEARETAEKLTMATDGVKAVDNQISVE